MLQWRIGFVVVLTVLQFFVISNIGAQAPVEVDLSQTANIRSVYPIGFRKSHQHAECTTEFSYSGIACEQRSGGLLSKNYILWQIRFF